MHKGSRILLYSIFLVVLAHTSVATAQSDGSIPPADIKPTTDVPTASEALTATTSQPSAASEPIPASSDSTGLNASLPRAGGVEPATPPREVAPVIPQTSALPPVGQDSVDATFVENVQAPQKSREVLLWPLIVLLSLIPFGFLAAHLLKKKSKSTDESDHRCFDIKSLLEEKFKELTDLRGMAEGKLKKVAKEHIREAVQGTDVGDVLVRLEKLESEYNRLKKLYEECVVEGDRYKYKGVLVENSLLDKDILEKLKVVQTRLSDGCVLHDIRLDSKQVSEIQRHMNDGPWYFHFWEPGRNDVTVVFKSKVFTIVLSDKATWVDVIAYGKSIGIPEPQLDFRIE